MNLATEVFGTVVVVHTPDELALEQSEVFERSVLALERRRVVLDLDGTERFDSRGLEALLNAQDQVRAAGGDVKIAVASPLNRKILEITRLDQQLEVFESVVDAVRSFR